MYTSDFQRGRAAADKLWQRLLKSTPHPDQWCTGCGITTRNDRLVIEVRVLPEYAEGILSLALAHVPPEIDGFPVKIVAREPARARKG